MNKWNARMAGRPVLLCLIALGFLALGAGEARADEVFISGNTAGCFGAGCAPVATATTQADVAAGRLRHRLQPQPRLSGVPIFARGQYRWNSAALALTKPFQQAVNRRERKLPRDEPAARFCRAARRPGDQRDLA